MPEDELPAALLTARQRSVLRQEVDISDRGVRASHSRMRERLRATMQDFDLVLRHMEASHIQRALERRAGVPDRKSGEAPPPAEREEIQLENGMASAISIVYLAEIERRAPLSAQDRTDLLTDARGVEARAEKGIRIALNRLGVSTESVDVDIDITLGEEFDHFAELDVAALAEYSMTELLQAHQAGTIDHDQFMAAMSEKGLTRNEE